MLVEKLYTFRACQWGPEQDHKDLKEGKNYWSTNKQTKIVRSAKQTSFLRISQGIKHDRVAQLFDADLADLIRSIEGKRNTHHLVCNEVAF